MIDNTPTFGGNRMGMEVTTHAGNSFIGNRVAFAKRNDASAVKGETSDPCYCGECDMTDERFM